MKKILLAALIAMSGSAVFAADAPANPQPGINPAFAKVEQYIQAKNYTAAYQELDKMGKQGNAQALYNQGYLTQIGQGTTKDNKKAVQLYQQASDKGYPVASYVLAQAYSTGGLGVAKDEKKARQYLEKASNEGFEDATVELAVLYFSEGNDKSDKLGLQKLEPLVKKGNYQAIHAKALYDISVGFKTKKEEPIKQGLNSIQDLAKKGYIPALMAMANMLVNGNIVQQNLPEARKIYAALAQDNVPNAKESLAAVDKLIAEQAKNPASKATPAKKK
nr:SEL1-like repeat protein [Acinetobacter sp. Marseille-Q1620]